MQRRTPWQLPLALAFAALAGAWLAPAGPAAAQEATPAPSPEAPAEDEDDCASGCIASWIQGDAALGQFTSKFFFELFGGGRSVQLYNRMKSATFFDGKDTWTEHRDDEEGFMLENREFLAALAQRRPPELSSGDGIQATRMVLAADAAIRLQGLGYDGCWTAEINHDPFLPLALAAEHTTSIDGVRIVKIWNYK